MLTDITITFLFLVKALLALASLGSVVALLIQLGKQAFPKVFANDTAQNFRLGFAALIGLFLVLAPYLGVTTTIEQIDLFLKAISEVGTLMYPLIVAFIDWAAKQFYLRTLKGVGGVGKSYSPTLKSK